MAWNPGKVKAARVPTCRGRPAACFSPGFALYYPQNQNAPQRCFGRKGENAVMEDWFTIDRIDKDTYSISEYRHWEETHCYLLNGSERSRRAALPQSDGTTEGG